MFALQPPFKYPMHLVGFAESSDGLAFTKPDLNQHFLPNGQVRTFCCPDFCREVLTGQQGKCSSFAECWGLLDRVATSSPG